MENIDNFTLKVILWFVPGIVGYAILNYLIVHSKRDIIDWITNCIIISVLSYFFVALTGYLLSLFSINFLSPNFWFIDFMNGNDVQINGSDFLFAIIYSIVISFAVARANYSSVISNVAQKRNFTCKTDSLSTFQRACTEQDCAGQIVSIKDFRNRREYIGQISAYSNPTDGESLREIYLISVNIYNLDKPEIGPDILDAVYILMKSSEPVIEFYSNGATGGDKDEQKA